MSRLTAHHRVLFVEEPVRGDGQARLEYSAPHPGVRVLVPRTPIEAPGFHDGQLALLRPLLETYLREHGIDDCIAWFCTPLALPLIAHLRPRLVVYDRLDGAAGEDAAPQLRQRETALLGIADVVLAGGPSLYEASRSRHPHVHYLPGAVDAAHFAPPPEGRIDPEATKLQQSIARPRLGFFGVIDERIDFALLDSLAATRPDWHVVMVGPLVRLDEARLPRRPNLHWLGAQPYQRLPHLMADWDLCLMPFALNGATHYVSPLETLEYLAGEKPVVSTAVPDVVSLYGDLVRIAHSREEFVDACASYLTETPRQRNQRVARSVTTVSWSSWAQHARFVDGLLLEHAARVRRPVPMLPPDEVPDRTIAGAPALTLVVGRAAQPPRRAAAGAAITPMAMEGSGRSA